MNKDQVKGRVEEAKGAIKHAAGKAIGNDKLAAKGAAEKAGGQMQASMGDAKAKAGDVVKKSIHR